MPSDPRRDTHAPASHFRWVAEAFAKQVAKAQKGRYLGNDVPPKCVYIGMAEYSAGKPVKDVKRWLEEAVSLQLKIYEQWNWQFDVPDAPRHTADMMAAARLVGRAEELADASGRVSATTPDPPGVEALRSLIVTAFSDGVKPSVSPAAVADLRRLGQREPDLVQTYSLMEAVVGKSERAFDEQVATYLRERWTRAAKHFLGYLKKPKPLNLYAGQWSILVAGACEVRGRLPKLEPGLMAYIPVELVGATT
jgi:hypothetical protein